MFCYLLAIDCCQKALELKCKVLHGLLMCVQLFVDALLPHKKILKKYDKCKTNTANPIKTGIPNKLNICCFTMFFADLLYWVFDGAERNSDFGILTFV